MRAVDGEVHVGAERFVSPIVPCPVLVGRAVEADALAAALDVARQGRGAVVFVAGEAGIGKSRLVSELASNAAQRGVRVLRGRAVLGAGAAAFRPLAEALLPVIGELDATRTELAGWSPALAAIIPTIAPRVGVDLSAPVLGEAVLQMLRSVCSPTGCLLVLEDLHWADPETIAVIEHLSDNLQRAPVLCVVTVRPDEEGSARDLLSRVRAARTAQVLDLVRLNEAQVAAMVHSCTGGATAADVQRVVSLAEGVPFLVEELLVAPGLPASFSEAVEARLWALPEADRHVLRTAATFGRHFDWRLLPAATGEADGDVIDALERGVAAQLLAVEGEGFRFRHALTAEAVFSSVSPPRREVLAAAALAAVDATHPETPGYLRATVARLAERAGERGRAGQLYLALGDDALRRGALDTAVAALQRAAELLVGDARDVVHERLVEALVDAGRVDDALTLGRGLVAQLSGERAATVHLRLAGAAVTAARREGATEHLARAGKLIGSAGSPALHAELALREAELAIGTNDTARAEERARAALELASTEGLVEVECAALQLLGRAARRSSLEVAAAWFQQALDAADRHRLPVWRLRALHELGTIALLDRCEVDTLLKAQRLAESLGAMATVAVLDIEIAAGCAGLHDLEGHRTHGLAAVRRGSELGLDLVVAYGWHHVTAAAVLAGDCDQASSASREARAAAAGNLDIEGLLVGGCDAVAALAADDKGRALDAAERCAELLRGRDTAPPMHLRAAWPLLLAVDHRAETPAAIEEMEQAGLAVNRSGRGGLAMARAVLAGGHDPDGAAALALEADEMLTFVPWWRHVVRRWAAEAAVTDGWPVPASWLAEAEDWFRTHGYPALEAACRRLATGVPNAMPAAWARYGITRREADVVSLVVEGLSNRDIAEHLYLSVRTVEKHVESLLRKTGTKTRTQLARVATST